MQCSQWLLKLKGRNGTETWELRRESPRCSTARPAPPKGGISERARSPRAPSAGLGGSHRVCSGRAASKQCHAGVGSNLAARADAASRPPGLLSVCGQAILRRRSCSDGISGEAASCPGSAISECWSLRGVRATEIGSEGATRPTDGVRAGAVKRAPRARTSAWSQYIYVNTRRIHLLYLHIRIRSRSMLDIHRIQMSTHAHTSSEACWKCQMVDRIVIKWRCHDHGCDLV